jgi:hypothetical protein
LGTSASFVRCFLENAKRDPLTGENRKDDHVCGQPQACDQAGDVAQRGSNAPVAGGIRRWLHIRLQVTSGITGAQQMTRRYRRRHGFRVLRFLGARGFPAAACELTQKRQNETEYKAH